MQLALAVPYTCMEVIKEFDFLVRSVEDIKPSDFGISLLWMIRSEDSLLDKEAVNKMLSLWKYFKPKIIYSSQSDTPLNLGVTLELRNQLEESISIIPQASSQDQHLLALLCKVFKGIGFNWSLPKRPRRAKECPFSPLIIYDGFKNLDELRTNPPDVLITSIPFTAAAMGIALKDRERRPKNLVSYQATMSLSDACLRLAIKNIQAIREAADVRS